MGETLDNPFAGDPYPDIQPALLNSADLRAYAEDRGQGKRLFEPFHPNDLKSASYEVRFQGSLFSWKGVNDPNRHQQRLESDGSSVVIPENGIVFFWPDVEFNVPPYLALRFNLSIRLVHRGLLLGTGPLVDPGFRGHLLIPVHNLTDHPVEVKATDGFIWVEVTKVSPYPPPRNAQGGAVHNWRYVPFNPKKLDLKVGDYFEKANRGAPIRSSIPSIADKAREVTETVRSEWHRFEDKQETERQRLGSAVAELERRIQHEREKLTQEIRTEADRLAAKVKILEVGGVIAILVTVILGLGSSIYFVQQIAESTKQLVESTKALVVSARQGSEAIVQEKGTPSAESTSAVVSGTPASQTRGAGATKKSAASPPRAGGAASNAN